MSGLKVAFAGLGVMGTPMAQNIQRAGYQITVTDIVPAARERAASEGLEVAETLEEAVSGADVIITVLPDTPQVTDLVRGPKGLLEIAPAGTIFVDMSSISPLATVDLARELGEVGVGMVDAPVSGGFQKALSGHLSIMAGGAAEHLDRVRPVLEAMGSVTHMGGSGTGQATKVCNQVAVTLTMQATCEAFALGSKLGVDLPRLREALLGGSASSWILENTAPFMLAGDDAPGFRIALQVKDLRIANDSAQQSATYLPGLSTVLGLYTEAIAHGQVGDGNQSLYRVYERLTGATIAQNTADSAAPSN
jgi:2-hydroxy-3-oxopropionate reductase